MVFPWGKRKQLCGEKLEKALAMRIFIITPTPFYRLQNASLMHYPPGCYVAAVAGIIMGIFLVLKHILTGKIR